MFSKKMEDFGNHRRFTLRCMNCRLILVSCKLKNPIRTPNNYKIIKRAEKQFMYEQIRNITCILDMMQTKRDTCRNNMVIILNTDQQLYSECLVFMDQIKQAGHLKTLLRHVNTFYRLKQRKQGIHNSNVQLNRQFNNNNRSLTHNWDNQMNDNTTTTTLIWQTSLTNGW